MYWIMLRQPWKAETARPLQRASSLDEAKELISGHISGHYRLWLGDWHAENADTDEPVTILDFGPNGAAEYFVFSEPR